MRDFFEQDANGAPADPNESARRAARPVLRNRFFTSAGTEAVSEGFSITLDGKPVRTPARRLLAAPRPAIAEALRAEWDQQTETIDPARMPLTRLANSIIDGVADRREAVAEDIVKYLGSDLLFYRADSPEGLVAKQSAAWEPVVRWAADDLGARFVLAEGVVHARQPDHAIEAARSAIPTDAWRLGALHSVTSLTGSALLALALMRGFGDAASVWRAAHVDEDWNFEHWGFDDLAMTRRAARESEFNAAALVLDAMRDPIEPR
ncbi:ATP12 family protein [Bradyrhizobium sp. LHD-71]|uniref:ATP12 family chaperone protein n=1 Tax=Bradyrhizobium sp. LHD-71 TaxID=3072141 RepID=UPI00280CEEB3|nr:ATP12 family protein [Bradyrhizobium sp. LHD-71]MDQ8726412.1 ATP12 family protein [Bradyrhizobium sp. LHD-71]